MTQRKQVFWMIWYLFYMFLFAILVFTFPIEYMKIVFFVLQCLNAYLFMREMNKNTKNRVP